MRSIEREKDATLEHIGGIRAEESGNITKQEANRKLNESNKFEHIIEQATDIRMSGLLS